jgi:hypothetical protein
MMVLRVLNNLQPHFLMNLDNFSRVFALEPLQFNNYARTLHKSKKQTKTGIDFYI